LAADSAKLKKSDKCRSIRRLTIERRCSCTAKPSKTIKAQSRLLRRSSPPEKPSVKKHLQRIYRKLGVENRMAAANCGGNSLVISSTYVALTDFAAARITSSTTLGWDSMGT
jgi:hypothetical protein